MRYKTVIILILLLGFLLRTVNIQNNPPSLYGDELTIVYDAYSILKTGRDQTGAFLPLTFSMGAGRPALYVYLSIPFVAIFGPSALGVRALSILSGMGIIFLTFILARKLFNEKIAAAASLITAVSPWEIALSRGGFEAHFALFLALLGIYFFIKAKERPLFYIYSALSFGLTLHTYPTYKVSLLTFIPLLFYFQKEKDFVRYSKKYFAFGIIVFLILGFLSFSQTFIGGSETRFFNINIFSQAKINSEIEQKINFERHITNLPGSISKYFHNKRVEYGKIFLENYLQNFSMDFLFIHGDRNPRQNMATMGEFYFIDSIFILIGLISFWQRWKKAILFLIFWIALSPIPGAIIDLPHALRSSFMMPPLVILSALGLLTILNMKKRGASIIIGILFLIQVIFFIQKLYFLSPNEYSNFWSYSAKLASEIAIQNRSKYNYVILSDKIDGIEFAYPVYAKIEPDQVISQNKKGLLHDRTNLRNFQFKKFGNVYIGYIPDTNIENFIKSLDGSVLFIGSGSQLKFLPEFETIEDKGGSLAIVLSKKQ